MLMRFRRLLETRAFLRLLAIPLAQQARSMQNSPHARGADGRDVGVQHHVAQAAVSFQRMLQVKVDDGLFLPGFEPVIARDPTVVFVDRAVAFPPGVEFAGRDAEPRDKTPDPDLGLERPTPNEIDDLVADIGLGPGSG